MDDLIDATITALRALPKKRVIASSEELFIKYAGLPKVKAVPKPPPKIEIAPPPPKPAAAPTPKPVPKKAPLELEKPVVPEGRAKSQMGQFLAGLFPELRQHEAPLDDTKARRVKEAWKEQSATPAVAILATTAGPFLRNVAKAIDATFAPCRVVDVSHLESEGKWDLFLDSPGLQLVIAPDTVLWSCKKLLPLFKEYPKQNKRYVGAVPLLLLPDIALYRKDPQLKRSLWTLLCQTLSPPSS